VVSEVAMVLDFHTGDAVTPASETDEKFKNKRVGGRPRLHADQNCRDGFGASSVCRTRWWRRYHIGQCVRL